MIIVITYYTYHYIQSRDVKYDFAHVYKTRNMEVYTPKSFDALAAFMKSNNKQIFIKGAGYSHGGQTLIHKPSLHMLDVHGMI